jgi:hypothetical protein
MRFQAFLPCSWTLEQARNIWVSNCKSQDLKTLVSHTGLGICSLIDLLFKLLSAAEKIGYYVSRGCLCQARDLASGDLRHTLCVAHAHTGTGRRHFGKNNHCNFRTHNVRSAGFLLFTSFSNIPHFGFGFAFRFRRSRTTLHQTLLGRNFSTIRLCAAELSRDVLQGLEGPAGSSRMR